MLHKLIASFFLATTIGIVLYTMYAAFHYSSNAILGRDEANFIILSTQEILAASSVGELIKGLFVNHGQHTLFGMQLVNLFTYLSFGALDRRIMNVIGVAMICLAALLIPGRFGIKKIETIFIYATLLPIILSPAHNACIVNASCTGNHYFGIATSVISLYFFTKIVEKKCNLLFAELFMFLAIFSLPAALALIPVSLVILLKIKQPKLTSVIGLHVIFICLIVAFHSYLTYPNTIFSFTQNTESTSLWQIAQEAALFVLTFFVIVGSLFYWLADMGYAWILAVVGVIATIVIAVIILKTYKRVNQNAFTFPFYGALLFLAMIAIISFGRYYSFGSSRYSVYTAFLFAMWLMLGFSCINQSNDVVHAARRIKILIFSSGVSLVYFFVALHYHQQYLLDLEQKDNICRQLWRTEGYACGVMIPHQEATQIIKSAIDQGIYQVEQ